MQVSLMQVGLMQISLAQVRLARWLIFVTIQTVVGGASLAIAAPAIPDQQPTRSPLAAAPSPTQFKLAQQVNDSLNAQPANDFRAVLAGRSVPGAVTSQTPSQTRLSIPSLWWISAQLADLEQFGSKFIQEWIAYPGQNGQPGRVDLLVNRQQWSLLNFIQRYEFVNKFSTTARGYGFNTRVYDSPDRSPIALYMCDFSPVAARLLPSSTLQLSATAIDTRANLSNQLTCNLNLVGSSSRLRLPSSSNVKPKTN